MSVAKTLPPVDPFFMQECPLCGHVQRMMIRGLYVDPETTRSMLYPDMGYSFCNCRNIFFTKWQNVTRPCASLNSEKYPLKKLEDIFNQSTPESVIKITMRDPYFVIWSRPHEYTGFNPRVNYILWDMDSFADACKEQGFELVSKVRDMDVASETPECYHITLKKPL